MNQHMRWLPHILQLVTQVVVNMDHYVLVPLLDTLQLVSIDLDVGNMLVHVDVVDPPVP